MSTFVRYAWGSQFSLQQSPEDAVTDFTRPWDLSDIAFVVEGRLIYASKTILAMWSPVMRAMFTDDFKERVAKEIALPDKHYNDILELVKVLHPPNADIDESNVCLILELAREYQMERLRGRAERFLLSQQPSVQALRLAEEYGLHHVHQACMDHVRAVPLRVLHANTDFTLLNNHTKVEILQEKCERYEKILTDIHVMVKGEKPEKMQFREGGTMCTFTCPDKGGLRDTPFYKEKSDKKAAGAGAAPKERGSRSRGGRDDSKAMAHNAGTESKCRSCALYMVAKIRAKCNPPALLL